MKRLTQFKIEFLRPFTGCRKVLGKIPVEKYFSLENMRKMRQGD